MIDEESNLDRQTDVDNHNLWCAVSRRTPDMGVHS